MEDKGGGVVNSGERVEILWVVVRKDDLEASSDSIPQITVVRTTYEVQCGFFFLVYLEDAPLLLSRHNLTIAAAHY